MAIYYSGRIRGVVILAGEGEIMQSESNHNDPDRRRFTRVEFHAVAMVRQGEVFFETKIVDVSLNGILLDTPDTYHIRADEPAVISIHLGDDVVITLQSVLVHSSNHFQGFRVESIDMDSICHLRRLIELNMNDPAAPERVLEELITPRQGK